MYMNNFGVFNIHQYIWRHLMLMCVCMCACAYVLNVFWWKKVFHIKDKTTTKISVHFYICSCMLACIYGEEEARCMCLYVSLFELIVCVIGAWYFSRSSWEGEWWKLRPNEHVCLSANLNCLYHVVCLKITVKI